MTGDGRTARRTHKEAKSAAGEASSTRGQALDEFWRIRRRRLLILGGILIAVVVMFVVAMMVGPIRVSALDIARTYAGMSVPGSTRTVVLELRTPPALMAVVVGAALALAGAQMQTILDNPLAEPYTLGGGRLRCGDRDRHRAQLPCVPGGVGADRCFRARTAG